MKVKLKTGQPYSVLIMENQNGPSGRPRVKRSIRVKIISIGNAETGKSCIIKRYCEKRFVHKYLTTIGIDYGVTRVVVKDKEVKVNIFDMAGHPVFYEVRNEFYKDTQGAVFVYDVTDRSSFESLEAWLTEMKRDIGNQSDMENVTFCVCANKIDKKPRCVDEVEGRLWAECRGFHYFETSAQSGEGITDMFQALFEGVVSAAENGGKKQPFQTQLGYSKDQIEAIGRLKSAKSDHERLSILPGASKDDINRAYRKLAVLLHPDKSVAPGSEEAFKLLVAARTNLLKKAS